MLPPKGNKNNVALKPLLRNNSTEVRRNLSVEGRSRREIETHLHYPKSKNEDLGAKKIMFKDKKVLLTEKRVDERERNKMYTQSFKKFYSILNSKIPKN